MTIESAPAQRIADARYRLLAARGHMLPEGLSEFALDALLTQLAAAVNPGQQVLAKTDVAELVEVACKLALKRAAEQNTCPVCGHAWGDHLGHVGCLECQQCTEHRPADTERAADLGSRIDLVAVGGGRR